jgi:hypothetical protein
MNALLNLLSDCKTQRICIQIPCTTCGARGFRGRLESIGAEKVLLELGNLDFDTVSSHSITIRAIYKWLHYEWLVDDPSDLQPIEDSPAWRYFVDSYNDRQEAKVKSDENRIKEEARQLEFRKLKIAKASYDLPNAIARGDIKAARALLAKGADPDFDRGPGMNTARQIARLWGREEYLSPVGETNSSGQSV